MDLGSKGKEVKVSREFTIMIGKGNKAVGIFNCNVRLVLELKSNDGPFNEKSSLNVNILDPITIKFEFAL